MFSTKDMPSPSSLFSAYASVAATAMLLRSMANDLFPAPLRGFLLSTLHRLFKSHFLADPTLTLVVDESAGMFPNELFDAASDYLATRIGPDTERLKISRVPREKVLRIGFEKGETFRDSHNGVDDLRWRFVCSNVPPKNHQPRALPPARSFELSFHRRYKQKVLNSYIPSVVEAAKRIREGERELKMHTLYGQSGRNHAGGGGGGARWQSVSLEHPATFETLAMEEGAKAAVVEDLDRFVRRKEFYRRVGRAWKRGYLLYGPPGSGKSSLVAAVANYLKFDVYDLQLASISRDSDLRRLLLATANRSILVIEDIDCNVDLPDRIKSDRPRRHHQQQQDSIARTTLTLSGLLNFIDGLWSSCGDERIIIFTTNHKDRLDPALLRPGRMDMHIHMSYCTFHAFKLLASNYLGIRGGHDQVFAEIEALIAGAEVTPAQVAEELMRSEDSEIALRGLVSLLKRKRSNSVDVVGDENGAKKRQKAAKKQVVSRSRSSKRKVVL